MSSNAPLHDTDFYAWANEQAALLRSGRLTEADIENIAEEIESMGRSEKRELVNQLSVLLLHLLKWRYQPMLQGKSWQTTIEQQRLHLTEHLADNPSLRSRLDEVIPVAYRHAIIDAEQQTGISRKNFPPTCPFTFDEAMNLDFWPD